MPRISETDIERIKSETDLIGLVQSRGIKLQQQGKNWVGLCPFHDDQESPNLIVTPAKGLFRCMASHCGKSGNSIQFVQWHDGISFRHAFELLNNGGTAVFESNQQVNRSQRIKLSNPLNASDKDDSKLLDRVAKFYHSKFDPACMDYLNSRGIANELMVQTFCIGNADRSLGLSIPNGRTAEGAEIRSKLIEIGVYRDTGREHLNGCLTIPIQNLEGQVVQIYGRRLCPKSPKQLRHLCLAKPLVGIFNPESLNPKENR
jgi:DNA primase